LARLRFHLSLQYSSFFICVPLGYDVIWHICISPAQWKTIENDPPHNEYKLFRRILAL